MKSQYTGLKRILKAFSYSYYGFRAIFKSEAAFRQDLLVFILGLLVAMWLNIALTSKIMLISSLFLILLAEMINSAIETVIDRISEDYHELSKKAKDIGSLVVLTAFINAIFVWCGIVYSAYINV
jgi:diacylglycerol kinase (ATP)